jgi:hypothetical protein
MGDPTGLAWLIRHHDIKALITGLLVRKVWPAGASRECG